MPKISIITAVVAGKDEHIMETYNSLVTQDLPSGWEIEWIVQEDGETEEPRKRIPDDDPRISYGTGTWSRASTARTLAMGRATGKYTRAVDADDILTPGALARDIEVLEREPIGWVVSPAIDLHPDGSLVPGPRDPAPGLLPDQTLLAGERAGLMPILGTTVTAHTALIHALGGWPAIPRGEDAAIVVALEAVSPGWMQSEPSLFYRRWPKQTTATGKLLDPYNAAPTIARAEALRELGWHWRAPNEVAGG